MAISGPLAEELQNHRRDAETQSERIRKKRRENAEGAEVTSRYPDGAVHWEQSPSPGSVEEAEDAKGVLPFWRLAVLSALR